MDPDKLKVAELRDELKDRGLDTKGVKAVLVQRLKDALDAEAGGVHGGGGGAAVVKDQGDEEQEEEEEEEEQEGEEEAEENFEVTEAEQEESAAEGEDAAAAEGEDAAAADGEDAAAADGEDAAAADAEDAAAEEEGGGEEEALEENGDGAEQQEPAEEADKDVEMAEDQGDKFKTVNESSSQEDNKGERGVKRKHSMEQHSHHRSNSIEKRRSQSPPAKKIEMDDCTWESCTTFQIDRYNCDLNLRIEDNGLKAYPRTVEGFAFMWAGARAMFGVKAGKVAYEVKLLKNLNVDHLPSDESCTHELRVGWSADSTSLQLGEEPLSYGYGGTSKAATNCEFKDYGESFTTEDVITAYLDMDSDPVTISFSKNGTDLGVCYEVEKEKLENCALFPHILTKNTEFECNFGSREEPFFALKEGYSFLETVGEDDRVRGSQPPSTKEECEVIMMVGLPGAGKTVWAEKHAEVNLAKKYNILGIKNIINKMRVMGQPRKENYSGKWEVLIDKSNNVLSRFIEIAAHKKRNYIIDQTNVYASARGRIMQPFEGFQRKAVIVVPTDEEFKSRVEKREKEEGKDEPEKAVLAMKANFVLPEVGRLFESIEYSEEQELSKEEAKKLVAKYREEASKLLPPQEKRFKDGRWGSDRGRRDFSARGSGYRGGFDRDRRGGGGGYGGNRGSYNPRGSYSSYDSQHGRFDDRPSYGSSGNNYRSTGVYQDQRTGGYGSSGGYGGSSGYGGGYSKGWGQQGWGGSGYGQWAGNTSGYGADRAYGQWPQQGSWGQYWGGYGSSGYGSSGYGSGYGSSGYGSSGYGNSGYGSSGYGSSGYGSSGYGSSGYGSYSGYYR